MIDPANGITKEINPLFLAWIQQDQNVPCWINMTLSEGVLSHVLGLKPSREVWLSLEYRFSSLPCSHIFQLKTQLQSMKKGSLSITNHVQRVKHLFDRLAAVSDEDLIIYTLYGS